MRPFGSLQTSENLTNLIFGRNGLRKDSGFNMYATFILIHARTGKVHMIV